MVLSGERRIAAPRQRVWEALNDPAILARALPGCESLERTADDRFAAVIEIKVGPIGARFKGAVTLTELDPPASYVIVGEGQGGMAGNAKGKAHVTLADEGAATLLRYKVDAEVGGRLAQLGGPIIDATAKRLAETFFARFEEAVVGGDAAAPAVAPAAAASSAVAVSSSSPAPAAVRTAGNPIAWLLAVALAAVIGFLVGRGGDGGADWMGIAIGLLVAAVGGAGIELGRSLASPRIVLDDAALARLFGTPR